jgi:hypothetical protein
MTFNLFKSFSVSGLSGDPAPTKTFGLPDNQWGEIESLTTGLPWDMKFGMLNAADINNAKGDLEAMQAQLAYWKEYGKTQRQTLDTYEDVKAEQVSLAKATMQSRKTHAALDLKASEAYYGHQAGMAIAGQQNTNAADLARLQQQLGIKLENHRHGLNKRFLHDEYGQERGLADERYNQKRRSLVDRYRSKLEGIRNPVQRESEFSPTPGRVLKFGRRSA